MSNTSNYKADLNNITIDVTKKEIVEAFINAHKKNVYTPIMFTKQMLLKCFATILFVAAFMIPAFLVNGSLFLMFIGPLLGRLLVGAGIDEIFGVESFNDLIQKLKRYYWICDVMENEIRYASVTDLLNMNYIYTSNERLHFLHRLQNETFNIKQNDYNGALYVEWKESGDTESLNAMDYPLLSKPYVKKYDVIFGMKTTKIVPIDSTNIETKDKLPSDVWLSEEEKQRRRDKHRQKYRNNKNETDYNSCKDCSYAYTGKRTKYDDSAVNIDAHKLSLTGDKYDDFRDVYNKVIDTTIAYLKEECHRCKYYDT